MSCEQRELHFTFVKDVRLVKKEEKKRLEDKKQGNNLNAKRKLLLSNSFYLGSLECSCLGKFLGLVEKKILKEI